MFTELFPILAVTDVPRALGFYRDLLGGSVVYEFPGPDGTPAYVALDIGASHLGIGPSPDAAAEGRRNVSLWVYADDCDAAVDRLRAAAVTITEEPTDQPGASGSREQSTPWATRSSSANEQPQASLGRRHRRVSRAAGRGPPRGFRST